MIVTASRRVRHTPLLLAACGLALLALHGATLAVAEEPAHSAALDEAIIKAAHRHGVPEKLVRRIVMRESRYNPRARNHSFWGLMQISYPTAKSMGFKGSPGELLNPVVNLRYAVPYLANAFVIAGKSEDAAVRLYASGYYATAKARGLLSALRTADSTPLAAGTEEPAPVAVASADTAPAPDYGVFGSLFGAGQQPQAAQAQIAYAAPADQQAAQPQAAQPQATPASVKLPEGKVSADTRDLTPDRKGVLHPPKTWLRDGGVTSIARGEQSVEQVEANQRIAAADDHADRRRHAATAKVTTFAALEAPPAAAQAYAGAATQDPRLLQADSQAAITQATAGQAAPPAAQPEAPAAEPTKKTHGRHVARRHHHETSGDAVAKAGDLRTADPAPDAQAAQGQIPAQPGPPQTAEAAPADPAAAAAPQQTSAPTDDATPDRKRRVHHAKKKPTAAAVAAQQPDDGQPR